MRLPVRLLNIARCGDSEVCRFNLDCMKLERIDGHNVAMASDGYIAIVSATRTEEEIPCDDSISLANAALVIDVAAVNGADTVEVFSREIFVGRMHVSHEPSEGRFPNLLSEDNWATLSDGKAVSVVLDIKRLRKLVEILDDAMPDVERKDMVMTVSPDSQIVFTAKAEGELTAGALNTIRGSNVPAWNPSDLRRPEPEPTKT